MSAIVELLWAVRAGVVVVLASLWSALWITLGLVARLLTGGPAATMWMAQNCWAPFLLWISGTRCEVRGLASDEEPGSGADGGPEGGMAPAELHGKLVVMNHQSLLDIVVAIRHLPVPIRFVAKRELQRVPFLGWHMTSMGMVFIDRQATALTLARLGGAVELLRGGGTVLGFPEGTRSRDGRVAPFKTGVFVPAIQAEAPVVPVAIAGSGQVLPRDGLRIRPGRVVLSVGRPIPTAGLGVEDRKTLAAAAREQVVDLLAVVGQGAELQSERNAAPG